MTGKPEGIRPAELLTVERPDAPNSLREGLTIIQPKPCQWVHYPEVTPARRPALWSNRTRLFIAESFGGWDGHGVAGREQAGGGGAGGEKRGGPGQNGLRQRGLEPGGQERG